MLLDKALLAVLAAATASAIPILSRQSGTVRGANLGGWLVLEPWITPSIFQNGGGAIDEYTLCQNNPNAESILQSHWASWVTQGDIQKIAANGLNLVRIPVGYWAFEKYPGDPYIKGAAEYLDQAVEWAAAAGLSVWIDLHGAPLSQNGYDNSGQRTLNPQWTSGDSSSFTAGVIGQINDRYGSNSAVVGIELVNEPVLSALPGGRDGVSSYYSSASSGLSTGTVFHDGFASASSWNGFLPGATIDHHEYQAFATEDLQLSYQGHVDAIESKSAMYSGASHTVVIGEWTAAMTDCAPALNGYGIGARYDGTYSKQNPDGSYSSSFYIGSCATKNYIDQWDDAMKTGTTNYIQAQISKYESLGGWIFWNFKTEATAEWDMFRLIDAGVWPS